jgi:PAS domain S-box-containing protein
MSFGLAALLLPAVSANAAEGASFAALGPEAIWLRWIGAIFVIMAIGGLLVFWINLRLQGQVGAQTRALRASEVRMRNLFENTPVAIVEMDFSAVVAWLDGLRREGVTDLLTHLAAHQGLSAEKFPLVRVIAANRTVLRLSGARDVEDYERLRIKTRTPAVIDAFEAQLCALWDGALEMTRELRYRGVDGLPGHSLMHWSMPEEAGRPDHTRVQVAFTDLGMLRATEEKLREIEDRWRLAVISINAGIWEYNFTTGEMFFSDRWKEIIGFAPEELPNERGEFWVRIHSDDLERVKQAMSDYLGGQSGSYSVEFRMRCRDGSYKWILSRGRALFDATGKPQRLIGAHSDIDESKRAEAALRSSSARYRMLFESNPSPMWVYDRSTFVFLMVNTAAVRAYGYTREEFLQMTIFDLRTSVEAERLREAIAGRPAGGHEHDPLLWRHLCKDGTEVYAEVATRDYELDGRPAVLVVAQDVTQRHLAEEQLRSSETRYRTLFESAVEGVYESTADGFRSVNPALARMFGFANPAEMLGDRRRDFSALYVQPGRRAEFLALMRERDALFDFESEIRRPDGSTRWISENASAVRDRNGQLLYIHGFVSDITDRRQAEDALRSSEERYRVLFENAPVAILEYDFSPVLRWLRKARENGVRDIAAYLDDDAAAYAAAMERVELVGLNREAMQLVAASSKQEVVESLRAVFIGEAEIGHRSVCRALWEGRNSLEGELTINAIDGMPRRVFYRWWVPSLGGEASFAWTQIVLVDLTGIKRTEAALAAERERLSVTLRAMAEGVITTDMQGKVLFLNEAAGQLTGWSEEAAIGRRVDEVCVLRHEKTNAVVTVPVGAALSGANVIELPMDTVLLDRQGVPRLVEGRGAPIHDLNSQAIGAVLVLRDVTERARLEGEILRASKLESVGILAGGIAHDFNNLLTVVMGNLTLAMLDSQAMAAAGRWLQDAERGVMRARDLTQQLLTFARGGEPVRSAVRLPEVVREAANFALHGSKVRCEFAIDEDLWTAEVDKGQIGQVVQNLVINAVQATPEGGIMHIAMRNEHLSDSGSRPLAAGNYLCIEIRDTGSGIRPDHLPRIFDPYFTTKQSGSGLGLATVYSIIRKHQGHIEVESELGHGTVFRFWLPASPEARPALVEQASVPANLAGRVLFMDDEEPIRAIAEALLKRLGFEVTTVSDGREAVRVYAEGRRNGKSFDVVIMDLTVPGGMGGKAAMAELIKIDPQVKGIVSSGYSSDPVMANYRAHGFRGMVPKPYKLTDLAKTIRTVIEGGSGD